MSIIFGAINIDGQQDIKKAFDDMHQRLSRFPSDRFQQVTQKNNYQFGCMVRAFRKSSVYDQSPLDYEGLIINCHARIDNRESLLNTFGYDLTDIHRIPDSLLIAKAYLKWGDLWARYVIGDFVVAIFDKAKKQMLLYKDFLGQTALYYTYRQGTLYYCSSLVGLTFLSLDVNYAYLAGQIHRNYKEGDHTPYQDVFTVKSNYFVRVYKHAVSSVEYYRVPQKVIKCKNESEYFEEFRRLYYQAARRRLSETGNTASCLSGGLDSGSVTAIASRLLREQSKPLHAYTMSAKYVYDKEMDERHFVGEMRLAQLNVQHNGNIMHHLIQEEQNDIINELRLGYEMNASSHFSSNSYWLRKIFEGAKSADCDVLLNGQNGNLTVSWKGNQGDGPLTLFQQGQIKKGIRALVLGAYPQFMNSRFVEHNSFENIGVSKDVIEEYDIANNYLSFFRNWRNIQISTPYEMKSDMLGLNVNGDFGWADLSHYSGVFTTDPTADRDLVEFCLNVPNQVFCQGHETRRMIRVGLEQELPDKVRLNYKIGTQGLDNIKYIKAQQDSLSEYIKELDGQFFDSKILIETLNQICTSDEVNIFMTKGYSFLSLLGISYFLQRQQ